MQEVAGSIPVGSIIVSCAEFETYEYIPCGSEAVTLIKKVVVLLFLKGANSENRRNPQKSNPKTPVLLKNLSGRKS
jgi:hypothetical protein